MVKREQVDKKIRDLKLSQQREAILKHERAELIKMDLKRKQLKQKQLREK